MGTVASTYGDMYSFGILLLEMFTGKRPTDEMFKDGLNLHEFSKMAISKPLIELIDPILLQQEEACETSMGNASSNHNHSNIGKYKLVFNSYITSRSPLPAKAVNGWRSRAMD
ncbi:hypothetical protein LguiB_018378 [Lonicera macranthoides]